MVRCVWEREGGRGGGGEGRGEGRDWEGKMHPALGQLPAVNVRNDQVMECKPSLKDVYCLMVIEEH